MRRYPDGVRVDKIFQGIGRFSVKFRWLMVVVWLAGTVAATAGLPSLSSVTQGNNTAFLPASAPSQKAADLAAPFGASNLVPVPVIAAVPSGTLPPADQAWLTTLTSDLAKVPTVVKVRELGVSGAPGTPAAPGHAPATSPRTPAAPGRAPTTSVPAPATPGHAPTAFGHAPAPAASGHAPAAPAPGPTAPGRAPAPPAPAPPASAPAPPAPHHSPPAPAPTPTAPRHSRPAPAPTPTAPRHSRPAPAPATSAPAPTGSPRALAASTDAQLTSAYAPAGPGRAPTASPQAPAASGQAAQIQVLSSTPQGDQAGLKSLVDNVRAAIARAGPPPGLQVHLAGPAAIEVDQQKQSGSTGNEMQTASFIFILVLLMVIFRAVLAPFITVIPALMSVAIAGPIVGELGHHGLKVSSLAQLLLIVLVLGAGTDYGLFLVFRVRENLRDGQDNKDAVINALTKVGESITFSALTVVAALLSLLLATFQIYSTLGVPLAIGIGVTLLAGLTLLPALLAIFGRAAFWPTKNRAGAETTGVWGRMSARILKRPAVALTIGVLVFGALSAAVTGYASGGFGGSLTAPAGSDSAAGTALMSKYFPATAANPTNLVYKLGQPAWDNPETITAASARLGRSGLFTGVTGPLNPVGGAGLTPERYQRLHAALGSGPLPPAEPPALAGTVQPGEYQMYRATAQFVSPDGLTIQFQTGLKAGDPSTTEAMNAVPSVRNEASSVAPVLGATAYGVTGEAPAFHDISSISDSDLAHVIPIAILVIGVLLALVMRSLVAPLYLIASVALSYFAALGLAVVIFLKIGDNAGITFILPFLLFIFLLALGEDYNILVMTRIREEAHRYSLREAVARAVGVTGTTVTSAGLVLAGTFAVFAVIGGRQSGGSMVREVGFGLAAGVLMDTFVVRTVLVPCTVVLLGRWNWWPAKLGGPSPADAAAEAGAAAEAEAGAGAGAGAIAASADSPGLASPPAEEPAGEPAETLVKETSVKETRVKETADTVTITVTVTVADKAAVSATVTAADKATATDTALAVAMAKAKAAGTAAGPPEDEAGPHADGCSGVEAGSGIDVTLRD